MVTFRPGEDNGDWESFSCGPYRREHAEALAEAVALPRDGLYALVEPMYPALDGDAVTAEIAERRDEAAETEVAGDGPESGEFDILDDLAPEMTVLSMPDADQVRAGMETVMRRLLTYLDEQKKASIG